MSTRRANEPTDTNAPLAPADAEALDALVEAGFDAERVGEPLRARASRIARLLGLLDPGDGVRSSRLVDATIEQICGVEPALTADDAAAFDAWVENGYQVDRVPEALRARAARHEALSLLVTASEERGSSDASLVERTLALVQADIDARAEAMGFERANARRGVRMADFLSAAAVMLIAASVAWPVLSSVREQARRIACATNLHGAAHAMSGYASLNHDALPMLTAGYSGGTWWNVGKGPGRSNSANLYTLARDRYLPLSSLACPGNPLAPTVPASADEQDWKRLEEISYSYRVVSGPQTPRWSDPTRAVVMADRSPVVLRAVRGEPIVPEASSPNHSGRGQHILFNDGAAEWHTRPVLPNGDNIWLPRSLERVLHQMSGGRLTGRELPDGPDDAFVGP